MSKQSVVSSSATVIVACWTEPLGLTLGISFVTMSAIFFAIPLDKRCVEKTRSLGFADLQTHFSSLY